MNIWVLTLCIGATGWGCGSYQERPIGTKQECFEALKAMRTNDQAIAESNKKQSVVAYCAPAREKRND